VKSLQPGCFVGFNHGEAAGDIRLGEMGRPGPVSQKTGIGTDAGAANDASYQVAEFTYPILPKHRAARCGFIHCRNMTSFAWRRIRFTLTISAR